MKIICRHGYFIFQEQRVGQVSDFISRFGLNIVPVGSYYTFEDLESAPRHSIQGGQLLGNVAIKNFEGEPWEVFEQNSLVYNFDLGLVVPIASVVSTVKIDQAGNRFVSSGLILPGSTTVGGQRVRDYSAWYSRDTLRFLYSEVNYV